MTGTAIGGPVRLPDGTSIPLSAAMRAGDFIFVSGQVPFDADFNIVGDDIETQTRAVLDRLKQTLAAAGCDLADVVKTTVWLTHVQDFGRFNAVYADYFGDAPPARSTVRADLMGPGLLVEIEAVAYKPTD